MENYIQTYLPHLLLNDFDTEYRCYSDLVSKNSSFLHKLVLETNEHKILQEYLEIYLQTEKGIQELNLQNKEGYTPLMVACSNSDTFSTFRTIEILIKAGANLDIQNNYGLTALILTCFSKNKNSVETAKLLIDAGANLDMQYIGSCTALMKVCYQFDDYNTLNSYYRDRERSPVDMLNLLINSGANLRFQDEYGMSPLLFLLTTNIFKDYIKYYKKEDEQIIENFIKIKKIPIDNYNLLIDFKIISPIFREQYQDSKHYKRINLPLRILENYESKLSECILCFENKISLVCNYNHHTCHSCLQKENYKCSGCQIFL